MVCACREARTLALRACCPEIRHERYCRRGTPEARLAPLPSQFHSEVHGVYDALVKPVIEAEKW